MASHNSAQSIADILAATLVNQLVNGVRVMATQRKISLSRALETYITVLESTPDAFLSLVTAFQRKFQEYNPRERQHPQPLFVRQIMSVYIAREVITTMDDSAVQRVLRNTIAECLRAIYALISHKGLDEKIMAIQTSKPDDKKFVTYLVTEAKRIALAELGNVQLRQSMVGGERLTVDTKQHQIKTLSDKLIYLHGRFKLTLAERDELRAKLEASEAELSLLKTGRSRQQPREVIQPSLPDASSVLPDRNTMWQNRQAQEEEARRSAQQLAQQMAQQKSEDELKALVGVTSSRNGPKFEKSYPKNSNAQPAKEPSDDELDDEDFGEIVVDSDDELDF